MRQHGRIINAIRCHPRQARGLHPIALPYCRAFNHNDGRGKDARKADLNYNVRNYRHIHNLAPPNVAGVEEDTIYALSTAPGRSAIAIIRISGVLALLIYEALCPGKALPKPRQATLRSLHEPSTGETLDSGSLVLFFPGPKSVTGEDILELHIHGGPAIISSVLRAIAACNISSVKIRYAEAGEFTRRAFLNNRLDLTRAESLGDMLSATTEQQRRRALRGATGTSAKRYEAWRELLLQARGEMEALIDFAEDQQFADTPTELVANVTKQVVTLQERIEIHIKNANRGELLREGINVALIGKPNAGKSSLLNLIIGREAAIVSPEQGTTRDVLEIPLDLGGFLCRYVDTAGLRSQPEGVGIDKIGVVEQEGIRRARQRAEQADVVVFLLSYELNDQGIPSIMIDPEICKTMKECWENGSRVVIAINKIDILENRELADVQNIRNMICDILRYSVDGLFARQVPIELVSCKQAASTNKSKLQASGLPSLLNSLIETFKTMTSVISLSSDNQSQIYISDSSEWQESLGASERQRLLLEQCSGHLDSYLGQLQIQRTDIDGEPMLDVVLAAESLRLAADCLARITGRGEAGDVEEVLGVVFEKFCVGK